MNENYAHPALSGRRGVGILKGMYRLRAEAAARYAVNLLGSRGRSCAR